MENSPPKGMLPFFILLFSMMVITWLLIIAPYFADCFTEPTQQAILVAYTPVLIVILVLALQRYQKFAKILKIGFFSCIISIFNAIFYFVPFKWLFETSPFIMYSLAVALGPVAVIVILLWAETIYFALVKGWSDDISEYESFRDVFKTRLKALGLPAMIILNSFVQVVVETIACPKTVFCGEDELDELERGQPEKEANLPPPRLLEEPPTISGHQMSCGDPQDVIFETAENMDDKIAVS